MVAAVASMVIQRLPTATVLAERLEAAGEEQSAMLADLAQLAGANTCLCLA